MCASAAGVLVREDVPVSALVDCEAGFIGGSGDLHLFAAVFGYDKDIQKLARFPMMMCGSVIC